MTDLDIVIERIQTLAEQDDDPDDVYTPPTATLIARAAHLCRSAVALMARPFPCAAASYGEDGCIGLYWRPIAARAVSVELHPDDPARDYLYHRETESLVSDIEQPLTPELLAHWLDWYTEANEDARSVDSG